MKKEELKKAFNEKFEKITVSNELKSKTLNAINTKQKQKTSRLPYLRNFAAIFVVTLFCISIYFTRNVEKNSQNITTGEANNNVTLENNKTLRKSPLPSDTIESKKLIKEEASMLFDTISTNNVYSTPDNSSSFGTIQSAAIPKETEILSISEDEFLKQHPNAEKGYVIYENNKESLYIFSNGYLENIIIID